MRNLVKVKNNVFDLQIYFPTSSFQLNFESFFQFRFHFQIKTSRNFRWKVNQCLTFFIDFIVIFRPMKSIPDSPGIEHRPILYPPPAYSSKTNSSQNVSRSLSKMFSLVIVVVFRRRFSIHQHPLMNSKATSRTILIRMFKHLRKQRSQENLLYRLTCQRRRIRRFLDNFFTWISMVLNP